MKRLICTLMFISIISTASYAGQWQQDDAGWRYQNDDGTYEIGWYQDASGKWYYFDNETTYMLTDTTTPDGYLVSVDGAWQEGGETGIREYSEWNNTVELVISAIDDAPAEIESLGYSLPITVHYNNEYNDPYGGKINISSIEVSKESVAYMNLNVKTSYVRSALNVKCKIKLQDETSVDVERRYQFACPSEEFSEYLPLPIGVYKLTSRQVPVSAEIWIEEAEALN